jgi:hypothetical protein
MRLGDTSSGTAMLTDEEIDSFLDEYGDKHTAAAAAARTVGSQFSRLATKEVGKLKISTSQSSMHYYDLADRLEREGSRAGIAGGAYAGGISQSEKDSDYADTNWVGSRFKTGQFDNPGAE